MSDFLNSKDCAQVLKGMADPVRLRILRHLVAGEKSVTELVDDLKLSQPTVSHHLAILRRARLVSEERDGRRVLSKLHPAVAQHLSSEKEKIELGCCSVELRKE